MRDEAELTLREDVTMNRPQHGRPVGNMSRESTSDVASISAPNPLEQLLRFLAELENEKLSYRLLSLGQETCVVQVALPRERWRLLFHSDGRVACMLFTGQDVRSGLADFWSAALDDRVLEDAQTRLQDADSLSPFEQQLFFKQVMSKEKIHTTLARHRDALMFEIDLPDQVWEVEFFGDGSIESDQFLLSHDESSGGLRRFWLAATKQQ